MLPLSAPLTATMPVIHQAWRYVLRTVLLDATAAHHAAVLASPAVRKALARIDTVAKTGDIEGTRASCKALVRAIRSVLQEPAVPREIVEGVI